MFLTRTINDGRSVHMHRRHVASITSVCYAVHAQRIMMTQEGAYATEALSAYFTGAFLLCLSLLLIRLASDLHYGTSGKCVYVCVCFCVPVCSCVNVCMCLYVCACMCVYAHMYVCFTSPAPCY